MNEIYIFKDGKTIPAKIERLFETHGPYAIEGQRLDLLTKVQLLVDSSTTSTSQSGTSISKANTGSMVRRAVVGGVLTGGAGAIIGGLSGKRESAINTVSSETLNTELTAELIFEGGNFMYVLIKSMVSFHWLLGFTNLRPMTDDQLEVEKYNALNSRFEIQLQRAHQEAISVVCYPKHTGRTRRTRHRKAISLAGYPKSIDKEAVKNKEAEILDATFKILQNTPDVARVLDYSEFVNVYQNIFPQRNIELNKQVSNCSDLYSGNWGVLFFMVTFLLILISAIWNEFSSVSMGKSGDNGMQNSVPKQVSKSSNISKNSEMEERFTSEDLEIRSDVAFVPDEDKPFSGSYRTYYPNGNIKGVAHLKDGKFNGLMTWWALDGEKIKEINYKDGKVDGYANTEGDFAFIEFASQKQELIELNKATMQEIFAQLKSFPVSDREYEEMKGKIENAIEAHSTPERFLKIVKFSWHKEAFGTTVVASFVIKNKSPINIKDIKIRCEFKARSETVVDSSENTIYDIVMRESTNTFENINLGFIDPQASKGSCVILNATGI